MKIRDFNAYQFSTICAFRKTNLKQKNKKKGKIKDTANVSFFFLFHALVILIYKVLRGEGRRIFS